MPVCEISYAWSDLGHAAVHEDFASGHEATFVGREEERHRGRLLWAAHASDWRLSDQARDQRILLSRAVWMQLWP